MPQPTPQPARTSRRAVLLSTAAGAAGTLALAACGSDDSDEPEGGSNSEGSQETNGTEGSDGSDSAGEPLIAVDEVPVGRATAVTAPDGEEAFVFRADESTVAAFSALCTHQGCAVLAEGAELHCPCHGSVFDAATGEVRNGPAQEPLPSIPVRVEGDQIVTG